MSSVFLKNCVNLVWWVKLEYTVVDIQKSGITWESFNWQLSKQKSRVIYNAYETAMNSIWKSNTLDSLILQENQVYITVPDMLNA